MENLFQALNDLLVLQNRMMEDLIRLGQEEMAALRENNLDDLTRVTSEQDLAGRRLIRIEGERVEMQHRLSQAFDLSSPQTLEDVLPFAGERQREALVTIVEILRRNYTRLQDLNEVNRLLIKQSLVYVNRLLQAVTPAESKTYTSTGQVSGGVHSPGLVDRMI